MEVGCDIAHPTQGAADPEEASEVWEHICSVNPELQGDRFPSGVVSLMPGKENDVMYLCLGEIVTVTCKMDAGKIILGLESPNGNRSVDITVSKKDNQISPRLQLTGGVYEALLFAVVFSKGLGTVSRLSFGLWPSEIEKCCASVTEDESQAREVIDHKQQNAIRKIQKLFSLSPTSWVPDDSSTECRLCTDQFTFFKRRHHCRGCGDLYCGSCTQYTRLPRQPAMAQRVCSDCASYCAGVSDTASESTTADPGL
eukprot:TRINITY_DN8509_c5_g1_i1.p1 TRINITY_DN8509_c5_g1~~TRINITY_DN8509_c5_g1_i1.p1  ORF type:complete len:255 (+),score=36.66 TRINITY_DN8509_c5_g1_i1:114-878(+)